MPSTGLTLSFADAATAADLVLLEQEDDGAYAGRLTRLGMIRYIDHVLYASGDAAAPAVVDCGGAPGNINTAILVWPLKDDVCYRLFTTIGQLGAGTLGEVEETDTVSFTLTETASLRHTARRILSAEWLTGPWTTGGERIAPPPLTADGRELRANVPVYGSVRVRYAARLYRHPLRITWAEAKPLLAADDWSEWAVCLPAPGSPVALALSVSRGASEMAKSDGDCGRGGFRVEQEEGEWPPYCPPEDLRLKCDYCSGECE